MCHTAVYLGLIYMMFSDISLNIVEQSQEVGSVHGDLEKAEPYLVATAVVAGLFWVRTSPHALRNNSCRTENGNRRRGHAAPIREVSRRMRT
jgi:hypothetical protein